MRNERGSLTTLIPPRRRPAPPRSGRGRPAATTRRSENSRRDSRPGTVPPPARFGGDSRSTSSPARGLCMRPVSPPWRAIAPRSAPGLRVPETRADHGRTSGAGHGASLASLRSTSRTVDHGAHPLRVSSTSFRPSGDRRARPCEKLLRASREAGPPSTPGSAAWRATPLSRRDFRQTRWVGRAEMRPRLGATEERGRNANSGTRRAVRPVAGWPSGVRTNVQPAAPHS